MGYYGHWILNHSDGNIVSQNIFVINDFEHISVGAAAIVIDTQKDCNISNNDIYLNKNLQPPSNISGYVTGIAPVSASTVIGSLGNYNLSIYYNHIEDCHYGIWGHDTYNSTIIGNAIINCTYGIILENSDNQSKLNILEINIQPNQIKRNNFLRVTFPARNLYTTISSLINNVWDSNYWNNPRILPKTIIGFLKITPIIKLWGIPTNIQFDLHPAKEPYNIPIPR